jgi:hypothetical protein
MFAAFNTDPLNVVASKKKWLLLSLPNQTSTPSLHTSAPREAFPFVFTTIEVAATF